MQASELATLSMQTLHVSKRAVHMPEKPQEISTSEPDSFLRGWVHPKNSREQSAVNFSYSSDDGLIIVSVDRHLITSIVEARSYVPLSCLRCEQGTSKYQGLYPSEPTKKWSNPLELGKKYIQIENFKKSYCAHGKS